MSFNSRIKERREQLHLTRNELAEKIGVTQSAISNYENAISSPKVELLYKLFDALKCDANYLYQDEMNALVYENTGTPEEFENIIKKYRDLDSHGKEMVDFTLLKEWERSTKQYQKSSSAIYKYDTTCTSTKVAEPPSPYTLNAAHERTDVEITEEMRQHDEDIMDDENF